MIFSAALGDADNFISSVRKRNLVSHYDACFKAGSDPGSGTRLNCEAFEPKTESMDLSKMRLDGLPPPIGAPVAVGSEVAAEKGSCWCSRCNVSSDLDCTHLFILTFTGSKKHMNPNWRKRPLSKILIPERLPGYTESGISALQSVEIL